MKRRIIVLPLVMISLLTGCRKNQTLRSDIRQFIASFSLNEARKTYLDAGYTRTDISRENDKIIKNIETLTFNIKDLQNIAYEYDVKYYENDVLDTSKSRNKHVYIQDGQYYLDDNGQSSSITTERIVNNYVTTFFYRQEVESIHSLGMYLGDTIKEIIYDMQKYVTIDFEANTFTYDMPWGVKKDAEGYDFEELLVVDNLGMTKSCYIKQSNGIVEMETTISVYNNI